jgi:hypothetical protein
VGKNIYFLGTISGLGCIRERMRQVRTRGKDVTFHRVDQRRTWMGPSIEIEGRLPVGQSVVVIAGLSALSWAVLISIVVALRAVL